MPRNIIIKNNIPLSQLFLQKSSVKYFYFYHILLGYNEHYFRWKIIWDKILNLWASDPHRVQLAHNLFDGIVHSISDLLSCILFKGSRKKKPRYFMTSSQKVGREQFQNLIN